MSVLLTLKNVVNTKLLGVVPWSSVAVGNMTKTFLVADILTPKGHAYQLTVRSSSEAPPLGAVVLLDNSNPSKPKELIQGQNQDAAWHRVVEYIKAKEGGASSDIAAQVSTAIPEHLQAASAAIEPDDLEIPYPAMVYFIAGKGEFYRNGPALVTRVHADGSLNVTVFADGSDPFYQQNVQPRSDELRHHCFAEYPKPGEAYTPANLGTIKQLIADVLDVTKFDCSEAVNDALQAAIPGIVASVEAELATDEATVSSADVESMTGVHPAMLGRPEGARLMLDTRGFKEDDPIDDLASGGLIVQETPALMADPIDDHSLEELERLTAPDPAPATPQA